VIVVDDGSSDNIDEVVQPYLNRITFIKKKNEGISSAYNAAIKICRGEWIAICDGDDYWHPDKLCEQQKLISEEVGVIYCNKILFDETNQQFTRFVYPRNINNDPLKSLLKSFFASPSTIMIRKALFDECGYFNLSLSSSEDYDMWIRFASLRRYKFVSCSEFLTYKRVRTTSIQQMQGYKVLIPLVFDVLLRHKELFKNQLNLSERSFYWHIGFNYGWIIKKMFKEYQFRLFMRFLTSSFETHLISGAGAVYRFLFKKQQHIPWYQ
jgi:glycosyltransferase involved in cell wall biosynthesis